MSSFRRGQNQSRDLLPFEVAFFERFRRFLARILSGNSIATLVFARLAPRMAGQIRTTESENRPLEPEISWHDFPAMPIRVRYSDKVGPTGVCERSASFAFNYP